MELTTMKYNREEFLREEAACHIGSGNTAQSFGVLRFHKRTGIRAYA